MMNVFITFLNVFSQRFLHYAVDMQSMIVVNRYSEPSSQLGWIEIADWRGCGRTQCVQVYVHILATVRYDTRWCFNVRSKADMNRLDLPHGDDS